jgi:hypothetical protein
VCGGGGELLCRPLFLLAMCRPRCRSWCLQKQQVCQVGSSWKKYNAPRLQSTASIQLYQMVRAVKIMTAATHQRVDWCQGVAESYRRTFHVQSVYTWRVADDIRAL